MKKFRESLFKSVSIKFFLYQLGQFLISMKPSQISTIVPSAPGSAELRFCFSGLTFHFYGRTQVQWFNESEEESSQIWQTFCIHFDSQQ